MSAHLDTLRKIAKRIHRKFPWTDLDDLVNDGAVALLEASGDEDAKFIERRIRNAMLDSIKGEPYRYASSRCELVDVAAPSKPASDLRQEIEALPRLEGQVLLWRLDGFSQTEIASLFAMTRDDVRAIEARAIAKLRGRALMARAA